MQLWHHNLDFETEVMERASLAGGSLTLISLIQGKLMIGLMERDCSSLHKVSFYILSKFDPTYASTWQPVAF